MFVQSTLEEDDFTQLPKGCGEMSGSIGRLNRSLYGLTQASRSWPNHLLWHMKSFGFEQSQECVCDGFGRAWFCLHSGSRTCRRYFVRWGRVDATSFVVA